MQKKILIASIGFLALLLGAGFFVLQRDGGAPAPEIPLAQEKKNTDQQPAEKTEDIFTPDPELEKITPLSITRRNISVPDTEEITKTQEIIDRYLEKLDASIASSSTETDADVDIAISALMQSLQNSTKTTKYPTYFKPIESATTAPKLTDQEIFAIMYPKKQIELLNILQDLTVSEGGIPENERAVFDNESKIKAFYERSINWLCDTGKIYELGEKGDVIDCEMFKMVGTQPFFLMKKMEQDSLRATGKLPGHTMSLGYYYSFVNKKSLSDVLTRATELTKNVPEEYGSCPVPEKFTYENLSGLSLSKMASGVKNFFKGNEAHAGAGGSGYCFYFWPHKHAAVGCGREAGYKHMPMGGLLMINPCCHCYIKKYCIPIGCLNSTCADWNQALFAQIGTCGCSLM
jgi:hypothetical protein